LRKLSRRSRAEYTLLGTRPLDYIKEGRVPRRTSPIPQGNNPSAGRNTTLNRTKGSYSGYPNLYKSCVLCPRAYLRVPDHGDPHLLLCCGYLPWRSRGLNTDSWRPPWGRSSRSSGEFEGPIIKRLFIYNGSSRSIDDQLWNLHDYAIAKIHRGNDIHQLASRRV
jgi:hypothetical protein